MSPARFFRRFFSLALRWTLPASLLLQACAAQPRQDLPIPADGAAQTATPAPVSTAAYPARPQYRPGELVDYTAQTGDTLPALAAHFNTTEREIRDANPIIPADATTLPPGMPMKIPIYYEPLWGFPDPLLPDSLFVNGPAQIAFDPVAFSFDQPGWLKVLAEPSGGGRISGGELVQRVALNFSISPRLLLALVEYQAGGLSGADLPDFDAFPYPLGVEERGREGLYQQLLWAANTLNNAYYGWRKGSLRTFEFADGRLERPDPWQNAASVALMAYFAQVLSPQEYARAVYEQGFQKTYTALFGDPWQNLSPHIPGSLKQPAMVLPFEPDKIWAYTGGPHTGWGDGEPFAAIDFAPPSTSGGCIPSNEWATAVAEGNVVRTDTGVAVLDLDSDRDERTGWVIFYLHLAGQNKAAAGAHLAAGEPIGHPSCEGGKSTGTHVHIARKFNGEWVLASGPLAFNLDGWVAKDGTSAYAGTLERFSGLVTACTCADRASQIKAENVKPTAQP